MGILSGFCFPFFFTPIIKWFREDPAQVFSKYLSCIPSRILSAELTTCIFNNSPPCCCTAQWPSTCSWPGVQRTTLVCIRMHCAWDGKNNVGGLWVKCRSVMLQHIAWYNMMTWTQECNFLLRCIEEICKFGQIFRHPVHSGQLLPSDPQWTVRKVPRFPVTGHRNHRTPIQNVCTRNRESLSLRHSETLPALNSKQPGSAAVNLFAAGKLHAIVQPHNGKPLHLWQLVHHRPVQTKWWI